MSADSRPRDDDRDGSAWIEDYGPLDAMRSVSDVQRRGLDAAAEVVERFSAMVDGLADPTETPDPGQDPFGARGDQDETTSDEKDRSRFTRMRADAARAVDLYVELFQRTFEAYADMVEATASSDRPTGGNGTGGSSTHLVLPDAAAGGRVSATVWVHNQSGSVVDTTPRGTDLERHDGAVIPGDRTQFEPRILSGVQPGTSRAITVSVAVPDDAAPGVYHGLVLANGLEGTSVPVAVTVEAAGPGPPS